VSCPLCLSPKNKPIILKNFKRSIDYFHQKAMTTSIETLAHSPHFFKCEACFIIYRNPLFILPENEESKRYQSHENSLEDQRYIHYLTESIQPFLNYIPPNSSPKKLQGLDYGCGPSLSFESVLSPLGYDVKSYDKYFFNHTQLLQQKYDFLILHEVIEHFVNFKNEFEKALELLNPEGQILIRTELYPDDITAFEDWYYKNDSTHVIFLSDKTFEFLENTYNLKFQKLASNKFILKQ
jgi:hypothetical protein